MAKPANRYELISCAWGGHVLVGTDAASVGPADAVVVREAGGVRWHRCLRCDAWVPVSPPANPARPEVPSSVEIVVPLRGPRLRDRYVLRLIALERALHVVAFGGLAVVLLFFGRHHRALRTDYRDLMNDLSGGDPGSTALRGFLGHLHSLFLYSPTRVYELAAILFVYAGLEAVEGVGLWFGRRWAEYLTFTLTLAFIPFEIYELTSGVSAFKMITLVVNLAIVLYLLLAHRLFGVRGGERVRALRRQEQSGWESLARTAPPIAHSVGVARSDGVPVVDGGGDVQEGPALPGLPVAPETDRPPLAARSPRAGVTDPEG